MEIVFLERCVALCGVVFLRPRVALRVHPPVFAAQSAHDAELADVIGGGGIERVQIHVVDETVVIGLVFGLVWPSQYVLSS